MGGRVLGGSRRRVGTRVRRAVHAPLWIASESEKGNVKTRASSISPLTDRLFTAIVRRSAYSVILSFFALLNSSARLQSSLFEQPRPLWVRQEQYLIGNASAHNT